MWLLRFEIYKHLWNESSNWFDVASMFVWTLSCGLTVEKKVLIEATGIITNAGRSTNTIKKGAEATSNSVAGGEDQNKDWSAGCGNLVTACQYSCQNGSCNNLCWPCWNALLKFSTGGSAQPRSLKFSWKGISPSPSRTPPRKKKWWQQWHHDQQLTTNDWTDVVFR